MRVRETGTAGKMALSAAPRHEEEQQAEDRPTQHRGTILVYTRRVDSMVKERLDN